VTCGLLSIFFVAAPPPLLLRWGDSAAVKAEVVLWGGDSERAHYTAPLGFLLRAGCHLLSLGVLNGCWGGGARHWHDKALCILAHLVGLAVALVTNQGSLPFALFDSLLH
jgi:hypothetical protein